MRFNGHTKRNFQNKINNIMTKEHIIYFYFGETISIKMIIKNFKLETVFNFRLEFNQGTL